MKDIIKVVFVIIGTFIGAGFASGQEIYLFFFSYGINGLLGILISSILMGVVISKTLQIIKQNNVQNYKEFLDIIIHKKKKEKKTHKTQKFTNAQNSKRNSEENSESSIAIKLINLVVNTFTLVTFFIMIAGFGTYFAQEFGINQIVGSLVLATITYIILNTSVKGVVKANGIIVPILIILVGIIGILNLKNLPLLQIKNYMIANNDIAFVLQAILYASYNSILLIPVLITLNKYIKNNKQINKISILSSGIIAIMSTLIFLLLAKVDVDIEKLEMPAVYVVSNMFYILKYLYGFVILGSIFTTTISLGMSFLQNTSKNEKSYSQIVLIMCITSVIISKVGFSNLVNWLYPIFGYLGILQIYKIIIKKAPNTLKY